MLVKSYRFALYMRLMVETLAAMLGGFVAGVIALAVGGLGVLLSFRRTLGHALAAIGDLEQRHVSEVKRRAAGERPASPAPVHVVTDHPDATMSRAELLQRYGR